MRNKQPEENKWNVEIDYRYQHELKGVLLLADGGQIVWCQTLPQNSTHVRGQDKFG